MVVARGVARDEVDPLISIEISPIEVIQMGSEQRSPSRYWGSLERTMLALVVQLLMMILALVTAEVFADADPAVLDALGFFFSIAGFVTSYLVIAAASGLVFSLCQYIRNHHSQRLGEMAEQGFWFAIAIGIGYVTYTVVSPSNYSSIPEFWILEAIVGAAIVCICLIKSIPRSLWVRGYLAIRGGEIDAR